MQINHPNPYLSTRIPVFARNVVSTSHPLAAQAGLLILHKGGNAVDAAVAAAAVMTLVEPVSNGLGSDAFCILWDGQQLHGLNASGPAPQAWTPEYFKAKYGDGAPTPPMRGMDSVTIPGAVRGWVALSKRFGKLPFADLMAPAIEVAERGYLVPPVVQQKWAAATPVLQGIAGFADTFLPWGRAPEVGELFRFPAAARALKAIAATKKKKAVERSSIDQRIDYRWVDLRTDENQLMFKAQSCMVNAMRKFLLDQNFIEIHTPKLIAAASESGSEVFKVDYFDRNAYLAQSPQFYKQMAMAAGFERIFETGPVFRAEKSYTNKHATEFSGFDLEFSYITSYKDVMAMEEQLLKAGLQAVKDAYGDQIQELFGKEVIVPETPFPVVKLADLYKGLEEDFGYVVDDSEKGDLTTEAERLSYDWVKKHYNHEFLFVTDYDAEKRAFYHMRDENGVPQGYDLIWRGVEITTGAQREHRYEVLKKQAEEKGLADDVKFYLEFFQYGCPPHGGFGLGIDRLTMLLCGLTIKDAEFLFRGPNRLTP